MAAQGEMDALLGVDVPVPARLHADLVGKHVGVTEYLVVAGDRSAAEKGVVDVVPEEQIHVARLVPAHHRGAVKMERVPFARVDVEQALAKRDHGAQALQRAVLHIPELGFCVDAVDGVDDVLPVFFEQFAAHRDPLDDYLLVRCILLSRKRFT